MSDTIVYPVDLREGEGDIQTTMGIFSTMDLALAFIRKNLDTLLNGGWFTVIPEELDNDIFHDVEPPQRIVAVDRLGRMSDTHQPIRNGLFQDRTEWQAMVPGMRRLEEFDIISDGITVWVNSEQFCIGRFGKGGIDIHREPDLRYPDNLGECLFCTHEFVTIKDWKMFQVKMIELHGVVVDDTHRPDRLWRRGWFCPICKQMKLNDSGFKCLHRDQYPVSVDRIPWVDLIPVGQRPEVEMDKEDIEEMHTAEITFALVLFQQSLKR